jgi:hypothetical protein
MNEICSDLPHQVLGCWDVVAQRFGFSLPAVFIACWQRSLSVPKPANQNGGQMATIVLSGTRGPWLFLVIREGLGSAVRLRARSTQRLTNRLRLALEPERLENPRPPPEKIPGMERTRSETLKLFVVSDVGRRSSPLSSRRSVRSWQSFVPRSVGPFLASCLWPIKPRRIPGTDRVCWKR